MGYFANGTEGMLFEEQWCSRCIHNVEPEDGPGCPVWFSHLLFAYEETDSGSNAETILNLLIPRKGIVNECAMFVEGSPSRSSVRAGREREGQA